MKLILSAPSISSKTRKYVEYQLEEALPSIKKRLGKKKGPDTVIVRAHLTGNENDKKPQFVLTISFRLPDHTVAVQKKGEDIHQIVPACLSAIRKELRRCVARIRRDHLKRHRSSIRDAFEQFSRDVTVEPDLAQAPPKGYRPEASPLFARLRPLLGPLHGYARDSIHTARMAGELPGNLLTADDLVNQAVLNILETAGEAMRDPQVLEHHLYREVDQILAEEFRRQQPEQGELLSIEQPAPEEEDRWTLGQAEVDESEYYQPFEALRLEDVLIDEKVKDPEELTSDVEEHRIILKSLAKFPARARSAFYLNRVEGFDLFEIAMIQAREENEVARDVEECAQTLRDGLAQNGERIAASKVTAS